MKFGRCACAGLLLVAFAAASVSGFLRCCFRMVSTVIAVLSALFAGPGFCRSKICVKGVAYGARCASI